MVSNFRKISHGFTAAVTALSLSALGSASLAFAGQLTSVSVSLSNPQISANSNFTFSFKPELATDIQSVRFEFTTTPSGSSVPPTNVSTAGAAGTDLSAAGYVTYNAGASTGWNVNTATSGTVFVTNSAPKTSASGGTWIFTIPAITTPTDGACADGVSNSETCYVRITTYSDAAGTSAVVDKASASFTVVTAVSVTATIDPFLTFTVGGVTLESTAKTNDAQLSPEASAFITGTTPISIPFGSVTVGVPKYAQQYLDVRTNAKEGYTVSHKFITGAVSGNTLLKNVTNSEDVDAFIGAAGTATWGSPAAWAAPTGTAKSVNSSWIGMRSTGVGAQSSTLVWAPPAIDLGTANAVKSSIIPDNGTSTTRTYVTYKIEANAFAPADSYSGNMVYSVVAKY